MCVITLVPILSFSVSSEQKEQAEDKCCCTTLDTGQCLIRVRRNVDAKLNDAYTGALKEWSDHPSVIAKLRDAEHAWIAYRDANCESERRTCEGGTAGPNMWALCQIRLTRQRSEEIERIYLSEH